MSVGLRMFILCLFAAALPALGQTANQTAPGLPSALSAFEAKNYEVFVPMANALLASVPGARRAHLPHPGLGHRHPSCPLTLPRQLVRPGDPERGDRVHHLCLITVLDGIT